MKFGKIILQKCQIELDLAPLTPLAPMMVAIGDCQWHHLDGANGVVIVVVRIAIKGNFANGVISAISLGLSMVAIGNDGGKLMAPLLPVSPIDRK
jgi:hypothetical protein